MVTNKLLTMYLEKGTPDALATLDSSIKLSKVWSSNEKPWWISKSSL
jgi:hypothetical protein